MKYFIYGACSVLICLIGYALLTETKLGRKILFFFHDLFKSRRDEKI
jgi:hypothetical protein